MQGHDLTRRSILVVEDEYFAATDVERQLNSAGAMVVGPAANLDQALDLIESMPHIDAGILDINLGGEMVYPAADKLCERAVPFLFVTGYDASIIPIRFKHVVRCEKPVEPHALLDALRSIITSTTSAGCSDP